MGKTPDHGFTCQKRSLTSTGSPMAANPDVPAHGCAETSRQVLRQYPDLAAAYRFLLASLGHLGRRTECEALIKIAPADYDHYARHGPLWFGLRDFEHMLEGLRKAGWSE
jgi:hypothetical protein